MNPVAQSVRPKVLNFYLRHLRAAHIPELQNVSRYVEEAVVKQVARTPTGAEQDRDFDKLVKIEIYKLANDTTRWLASQQELVLREVRKSGIKDPRLPSMVMGLNTVQAKSTIDMFTRSPYAANKLAATYRRRRANVIANTETTKWVSVAQRAVWGAAKQQGYLPIETRIIWSNSRWDRVCDRCRLMHKQPSTPDGMFVTPEGFGIYSPPLHPNCRCGISLEGGD